MNHALASALGAWLTTVLTPATLRWMVGLSFLVMALWILVPDKLDDDTHLKPPAATASSASRW